MRPLRRLLDDIQPLFVKGGRLERFAALYEAVDTFLYLPGDVTRGRTSRWRRPGSRPPPGGAGTCSRRWASGSTRAASGTASGTGRSTSCRSTS